MTANHALAELFAHYTALDGAAASSALTDQDRQSLRFYRIERELIDNPHAFTGSHDRPTIWVRRLLALDTFVTWHDRMPRENNRHPRSAVPTQERMLADWVTYQRTPATRARHSDYQSQRLQCVAGFTWAPANDRWQTQYDAYREFLEQHHRAPRYRSQDPAERNLAGWAAKQRWRHRRGQLPVDRGQQLSRLGVWTWH